MIPGVKTGANNNLYIHLGRNHAWNNLLRGLQSVSPLRWHPFLVTMASGNSPSACWAPRDPGQPLGPGLRAEHSRHAPRAAACFHCTVWVKSNLGDFFPALQTRNHTAEYKCGSWADAGVRSSALNPREQKQAGKPRRAGELIKSVL